MGAAQTLKVRTFRQAFYALGVDPLSEHVLGDTKVTAIAPRGAQQVIHVVVALITRPIQPAKSVESGLKPRAAQGWVSSEEYFIAVRPDGPCEGLWEFPGGKIDPGETPYQALVREVQEEVGIQVHAGRPIFIIDSPSVKSADVICRLHVWNITDWSGEPYGAEGQPTQWTQLSWQDQAQFLPANRHMFSALRLGRCLLVHNLESSASIEQFQAELVQWEYLNQQLDGDLRVRLRAAQLTAEDYYSKITAIQGAMESSSVQFMVDVIPGTAFEQTTCWSLETLEAAYYSSRWIAHEPVLFAKVQAHIHRQNPDLLRGASCHSQEELQWACADERLGAHFYCLSPTQQTSSHPEAEPLGWQQWSTLNQLHLQPGYALGGVKLGDYPEVVQAGGYGIAGISSFGSSEQKSDWQGIQQVLVQQTSVLEGVQ